MNESGLVVKLSVAIDPVILILSLKGTCNTQYLRPRLDD